MYCTVMAIASGCAGQVLVWPHFQRPTCTCTLWITQQAPHNI